MTTNDYTPADLARFVHRVPEGATIPAGTEYAYRGLGSVVCGPVVAAVTITQRQRDGDIPRWTAEPIRRPLPTKPGSVITDVTDYNGDKWLYLMRDQNGRWSGVFHNGQWGYWAAPADSKIIDWTPGRIVPDDGSNQ